MRSHLRARCSHHGLAIPPGANESNPGVARARRHTHRLPHLRSHGRLLCLSLQMPIDKSDLYQKTLPEEDGKDTNLDVLLNYAKDEIKLDYTNLCAGPNGLPRRSGGIERALLSERGDAPIFVVRHHHHLLFVPPLTFHPHTIILLLSVVAGVRGHDEEERCDNHLERGEARGVVRPIRYAAGCRPAGDDELKRVAYWHVSVRIVSNTHCFRSEARSSAYTLFSGTTTPALRPSSFLGMTSRIRRRRERSSTRSSRVSMFTAYGSSPPSSSRRRRSRWRSSLRRGPVACRKEVVDGE